MGQELKVHGLTQSCRDGSGGLQTGRVGRPRRLNNDPVIRFGVVEEAGMLSERKKSISCGLRVAQEFE